MAPAPLLTRRSLIAGGVSSLAAALLFGCGSSSTRRPASRALRGPAAAPEAVASAQAQLASLEAPFGRLGVYALDTGSGSTVAHHGGDRFLLCSTFKALAVGAVLRQSDRQPGLLDRVIRYGPAQVIDNSPITAQHVADGMSVRAICAAALIPSDNTAANLLLGILRGPSAVTAFARSLGDQTTRVDRTEPTVNRVDPSGVEDTTTPADMAADVQKLVLGDALSPPARQQLVAWMEASTAGAALVRAAVPASWRVADKSGSGYLGEANDVAVVWPSNHAPLLLSIFSAPSDPSSTAAPATVARAAAIAVAPLVGTDALSGKA